MISIELTGNERISFQYLLPVQGSIETLETVEKILNKCKVSDPDLEKFVKVDFDEKEIELVKASIGILDKNQQLRLESLSLIKKIMNIKGA